MDKRKIACFLLCTAFLASACDKPADLPETAARENTTQVSMLSYEEQEAGTDLYPVRVLVSPGFLRLDDGYAESDFVLLDRHEKTIFSVSHEGHSIMVIENSPNDAALPADISLTVIRTPEKEAPSDVLRHLVQECPEWADDCRKSTGTSAISRQR